MAEEKGGKKSKKSKKKRDEEDDEDIEKMLAELEAEYSGLKPKEEDKPTSAPAEEVKLSKKSKKGGKKREGNLIAEELRDFEEIEANDYDSVAPKKKEKKKREVIIIIIFLLLTYISYSKKGNRLSNYT